MKIKLICFGKIKNSDLKSAISDFEKRIKHYVDFEVIELLEEKINNENNKSEIENALRKEASKLEKYLENKINIILDVDSKQYDSVEFSNIIKENITSWKQINFFIGSSYGFSDEIKNRFQYKISFSKMTFNHQIFRLMLCEQIYRSFCIINNIKYHK